MAKWLYTVEIKQFLDIDQYDVKELQQSAKNIANELRSKLPKGWHDEKLNSLDLDHDLLDILDHFDSIAEDTDADCNEFDYLLNELYDWADDNRVWLGL